MRHQIPILCLVGYLPHYLLDRMSSAGLRCIRHASCAMESGVHGEPTMQPKVSRDASWTPSPLVSLLCQNPMMSLPDYSNFTFPEHGSYGALTESGAVDAHYVLNHHRYTPKWCPASIVLQCWPENECFFTATQCTARQVVNSGPYEGANYDGFSLGGPEAGCSLAMSFTIKPLNNITDYPTYCQWAIKDWEAIDDPPCLAQILLRAQFQCHQSSRGGTK